MFAIINDLKISMKIMLFMVANLLVAAAVIAVAVYSLLGIGSKLTEIAEEDIPLTEAIVEITITQQKQAINIERALRYGVLMAVDEDAKQHFAETRLHFAELSRKVDEDIVAAGKMVAQFLSEVSDPALIKEFELVYAALKNIATEHSGYEQDVVEVFVLIEQGQLDAAVDAAELIEVTEELLGKELEALEKELQRFTEEAVQQAEKLETQALFAMILGTCIALLLAFLLMLASRKFISTPIQEAIGAFVKLSAGDTSVELRVISKDEVGDLARVLESFRIKTLILEKIIKTEKVAQQAHEQRALKMKHFISSLETKAGNVTSAVALAASDIGATARFMSSSVENAKGQTGDISLASEQGSVNVQTVAAASEQMEASIREISGQVQSVTTASNGVTDKATAANRTAQELQGASNKLGEIVEFIQDIAEQTNLLALNATIEAARAGDAGKGFAVVASEVKNLAGQTASATAEIEEQIQDVQNIANTVVEVFADIQHAVVTLSESADGIAAAVEKQSYATKEIAGNMINAASGTDHIYDNVSVSVVSQPISEANVASSEVVQNSEKLAEQALVMGKEVEEMSKEVKEFLEQISTA